MVAAVHGRCWAISYDGICVHVFVPHATKYSLGRPLSNELIAVLTGNRTFHLATKL